MSPFALYLIMNQELESLRHEPRRSKWTARDIADRGPSLLQRIRAAIALPEAPATTPTLLDYPYRS